MILSSPDWPTSGHHCFEFRMGIEGEAAAAAARHRTTDDLIVLADRVSQLESIDVSRDPGMEQDYQFHLCIAMASHNSFYVSVLNAIRDNIFGGMLLARTTSGLRTAEKVAAINEQHRAIYEAIVAGDENRAREAMRYHLTACRKSTSHWDAPA
jgi:GntR family transcriptional regulator, transcriptional repressor for pyruvate dehydrogenase complex